MIGTCKTRMRDQAQDSLRIVAVRTAKWEALEPSPIIRSACCEIPIDGALLLFSGNELRRFEADDGRTLPSLTSLLRIDVDGPTGIDMREGEVLADAPARSVTIAHGAATLRMHLRRPGTRGSWICTRRMARQVWPDAPGHGLRDLITWRGLHPAVSGRIGEQPLGTAVAETALLTALLLIALMEERSILDMCVASTAYVPPQRPGPDLEDAMGWARLPDDDLTWLSRIGGNDDRAIRSRAATEMERRFRSGQATPLLDEPPVHVVGEGRHPD